MAKKKTTPPMKIEIEMTQITVNVGRKKAIRIRLDGTEVNIPVDEALFTHWKNQFLDKRRTTDQKNRFSTMMNVVRAAYQQGLKDGSKER